MRAAEAILIEYGYARFTIQRVAEKLGISPGNVNYYFPTKASLLETLMVYTTIQYRRRVRSDVFGAAAGRQAVGELLRWWMEDAKSERTSRLFRELWVMATHDPRVSDALNAFYSRSVRNNVRRLKLRLTPAQAASDLDALVCLMLVISEGTTVLFGTRPASHELFERVHDLAGRAIEHLLVANSRKAPKRISQGSNSKTGD